MHRVLDLFSGIGGFSLGLERTGGFKTVAFCEIEAFPRAVLKRHWPDVPIYEDVRTLNAERIANDGITVDVICGGFPCQDISVAGKGAGLAGERSGLWREYARLVGELRPKYVIVENVAALLGRGLAHVLGDLASIGYDTEWHCIPASYVGAPHRRDRVWVVAYPSSLHINCGEVERKQGESQVPKLGDGDSTVDVADTLGHRIQRIATETLRGEHAFSWCANIRSVEELRGRSDLPESLVCRVNDGIAERLYAIGNMVIPQIPEVIGRAILSAK